MNKHETYIKRCIELAKNGLGTTYPNPMVGSVIVADGKIIGEGWHRKAGEPHAEVHAINSVDDKSLLKKATIYVSLEPCSHFGKTPPCADLIVRSEIPNVVIGTVDPNIQVAGKGIERLKNAGIGVTVGVLEKECQALNQRFFTFHNQKRPYIILKWAESQDGFIAPNPNPEHQRAPIWITNPYSRQLVHKWRSEEQGILVGTQTVLADNPKLDTRDWFGQNPTRLIIDRDGCIPEESCVLDQSVPTLVFTSKTNFVSKDNCRFEALDFDKNIVPQLLEKLYNHRLQSVIVEGGATTIQHFIDLNLWDEARIFVGAPFFDEGVKAPMIKKDSAEKSTVIGTDELIILRNHD
ncbi:MAG: bifunctional diaminohydroxyphosphoribosylaminopyrimidine deaminase/5-amino-6-(5-phosphoribosylamino)uracil reductase RibD [Flavobacterium sp.]